MNLETHIESYGRYTSHGYGAHTMKVRLNEMTLWYSYETLVAFSTFQDGRKVCQNVWGPTTGKHLNWIDGGSKLAKRNRLPVDQFKKVFQTALAREFGGEVPKTGLLPVPEVGERKLRFGDCR